MYVSICKCARPNAVVLAQQHANMDTMCMRHLKQRFSAISASVVVFHKPAPLHLPAQGLLPASSRPLSLTRWGTSGHGLHNLFPLSP